VLCDPPGSRRASGSGWPGCCHDGEDSTPRGCSTRGGGGIVPTPVYQHDLDWCVSGEGDVGKGSVEEVADTIPDREATKIDDVCRAGGSRDAARRNGRG